MFTANWTSDLHHGQYYYTEFAVTFAHKLQHQILDIKLLVSRTASAGFAPTYWLPCWAALFQIHPSACSPAPGRSMSAIAHMNSHCSNKSKCLWQKWLMTKTDANLFVFLRPKYPQKVGKSSKIVTQNIIIQGFSPFPCLYHPCRPHISVFCLLCPAIIYKKCI